MPIFPVKFKLLIAACVFSEHHQPGTFEKARLRFAHAETIVPFTCLLGLFLSESEFKQMQREEPLDLPPKPPKERNWRGNILAPFAGNNMVVLYNCPLNDSRSVLPGENRSKYFVQVLHNEAPIPMPAPSIHLVYEPPNVISSGTPGSSETWNWTHGYITLKILIHGNPIEAPLWGLIWVVTTEGQSCKDCDDLRVWGWSNKDAEPPVGASVRCEEAYPHRLIRGNPVEAPFVGTDMGSNHPGANTMRTMMV
ncbi:hypothetical protein ACLOJK_023336 [Asimina triloba]